MARKYFLALTVLGVFLLVGAGTAQAGWGGHSYESTQPGDTMSSGSFAPEETVGSTEAAPESMESSEYATDEAVETGRLPESEGSGSVLIFGDDVERQLQEGIIIGGP